MSRPTARSSDSISHGGQIITGSGNVLTDGLPTARMQDMAMCSKHGLVSIITGSNSVLTNGQLTARINDLLSCGAEIITGSANRLIGGPASSFSSQVVPGYQPWAAINDVAANLTEESPRGTLTDSQKKAFASAGIDPNQRNPNPPIITPETPAAATTVSAIPVNCGEIQKINSFPPSFKLSTNFSLGHVSTAATVSSVEVVAQSGLTVQQIVCNLQAVAINILEPLVTQYGRPDVTSGFRLAGSSDGKSVHKLGQAVDLQWPNISDSEYFIRACWIRDNLQWSQVILEFGGNRPWIHVSHGGNNSRTNTLTRITLASQYISGLVECKNTPRVGGTRI